MIVTLVGLTAATGTGVGVRVGATVGTAVEVAATGIDVATG